MSRRIVIAYWLIPADPAHSFFQGVINDLARRYDAPVFEPHVTVHVGSKRAAAAESAVSQAAHACKPIKLKALEIGHSSEFIKTLFVQFALNTELRQLNEIIRNAAQDASHYELKPHLSLLYKKMLAAARRELSVERGDWLARTHRAGRLHTRRNADRSGAPRSSARRRAIPRWRRLDHRLAELLRGFQDTDDPWALVH